MAHVQYIDELIREYLLYRGFGATLKVFDSDLKNDKEKGFRVDKIIDQLMHFITVYDLNSLRELWSHLDNHMFTKLESHFIPGAKKLEFAVLKLYLVNAVVTNKTDKINDFFAKMTSELQGLTEWKEWFMLPYIRNPEENSTFSLYFTKQWQDTLLVSLHNFLASIFQYMPLPTLLHYERDAQKIQALEEKNESLKKRLSLLIEKGPSDSSNNVSSINPCQVEPPPHLSDDFYIIAQESSGTDNQAKSLKNLIRNMGGGGSPILGRKENSSSMKRSVGSSVGGKSSKSGQSCFYDS